MVENKKISILIDSFIPYVLRFYLSMTTQVYSASVFKVILIYLKVFMYYLQTGLDLFIPFSKNKIIILLSSTKTKDSYLFLPQF